MLTEKTLDQILGVLDFTAKYKATGLPTSKAYQKAVKDIAHKYSVRYQTIADGCRRRLNLDNINEFMKLLDEWLGGHPERLKELIINNINEFDEYKVENFFDQNQLQSSFMPQDQKKVEEAFEVITFKIPRNISRQLRTLAEAEGKTTEYLASNIIKQYVDTHYVEYLKNLINSLPPAHREKVLASIANG